MKLGIAVLVISAGLLAAGSIPADAHGHAKGQPWGTHGNIAQTAADSAGSYALAGVLQAQQNFSLSEWTALPGATLTSNLQTLFSTPGATRFFSEDQLQQLRMLGAQRGVALPAQEPVADSEVRRHPAPTGAGAGAADGLGS